MDDDIKLNPIPIAPSCLCFKKDEFMNENFYVDEFISDHKKQVQLETLRDDLNVYLNVLKSAMIELINKDYADFLNLSSNLVGLDKAINNISVPLGQLREEVMSVKSVVDDAINLAQDKLLKKQQIRHKKVKVQRIISIHQRIEQIEGSLNITKMSSHCENVDLQLNGEQIERMAVEIHQLNFDLGKSDGLSVAEELRPRIDHLTFILQNSLEDLFLESIERNNSSSLCRCLRIYSAIDKIPEVEVLIRNKVVEPFLDQIITEKNLKEEKISGIFDRIMQTIPNICGRLLSVTYAGGVSGEENNVPGYDFLTNSIWPAIVSYLETRIPSIFAPGNPNMFHDKYSRSIQFLIQFEHLYSSLAQVKQLRSHPSYISFTSKWNLPVYFQIRHQEIASAFESILNSSPLSSCIESVDLASDQFRLRVTDTLYKSLCRGWSDEVFVPPISHRFWKLTLELLSRFDVWLTELITKEKKALSYQTKDEDDIQSQIVSLTSKQNLIDGVTADNNSEEKRIEEHLSLHDVVLLIADVDLLTLKLSSFFDMLVEPKLRLVTSSDLSVVKVSMTERCKEMSDKLRVLEDLMMFQVVNDCSVQLKFVADIPRLYRRTNKEVPTRPSEYVTNVLSPLHTFMNEHKDVLVSSDGIVDRISLWKAGVLEKVSEQYVAVTSDVLTSVKKTEDSLKRLKKARDRPYSTINVPGSGVGTSMSDDDKIRHQLYLDVEHYGQQITLFEVETSSIGSYVKMVQLVESARNSPEKS